MANLNLDAYGSYMFADALSGYFRPPTDRFGRAHTLSRLMLATLDRGEDIPSKHVTKYYEPSWAPGSVVMAEAYKGGSLRSLRIMRPDFSTPAVDMSEYYLTHDDIPEYDGMGFDRERLRKPGAPQQLVIMIGENLEEQVFPLEPSRLDEAREAVTHAAQQFYDTMYVDASNRQKWVENKES